MHKGSPEHYHNWRLRLARFRWALVRCAGSIGMELLAGACDEAGRMRPLAQVLDLAVQEIGGFPGGPRVNQPHGRESRRYDGSPFLLTIGGVVRGEPLHWDGRRAPH